MNRLAQTARSYIATVGMFDGVHRGHVFMLKQLREIALREGLDTLVLTFSHHPLEFIAPARAPKMLTTAEQRVALIDATGYADKVEVLNYTHDDFKRIGADFLKLLQERYQVTAFAMGFNNHIGCDRAGIEDLRTASLPVYGIGPLAEDVDVSSSAIRAFLSDGNLAAAENALGRPYKVVGQVVSGNQIGRTIGFPTANVSLSDNDLMLPARGVYAVDVRLSTEETFRGMANVGVRPTVAKEPTVDTLEVNIFDYNGNLYGEEVDVTFIARIREERAFPSIEALRKQLEDDRRVALNINR
ncbi:MAG: riboflavin biosynthesis protein RibF [Muribaculaceae bacterium]|nr:riboflavin biosynthesis protein RibF [Muribaculaceae bacterium]